jgi:hypothetical protein
MAHGVSRLHFTAKARVRSHSSPVRFVVEKVALGQVFVRVLRCSAAVSFHQRA